MASGPGDDRVDPAWAALAVRALVDGTPDPTSARGVVHLDVDGVWVTVRLGGGRRTVSSGRHGNADATVRATMPAALALTSGVGGPAEPSLSIVGDASLVGMAFPAAPDLGDAAGTTT